MISAGEGKIKFINVVVRKPANCLVHNDGVAANGTTETNQLKIHDDWMVANTANQHAFIQFLPKSGSVFAGLEFTNKSGTEFCPIAGQDNVTGTVFGESTNNTGVQAATSPVTFGASVQTTTSAQLKLGVNSATLTSSESFSIGVTFWANHH